MSPAPCAEAIFADQSVRSRPRDAPGDAVVPDLMRRGVTFVACNVAVKSLAKKLAPAGTSPDQIRDELAEGLLPGTVLVPDVFVAMQRAQQRGLAYIATDRAR